MLFYADSVTHTHSQKIFIQRFGKLDVDSKFGQRIFLGAALVGLTYCCGLRS